MASMSVFEITDPEHPSMRTFFEECRALGFNNNQSAESIKFRWAVQERRGKFWGLRIGERVVSMAGCHHLPELHPRAFRIQFRGCELPGADVKKTLSRAHFNSSTFRELIPFQLEWVRSQGDFEPYLSVNHGHRNHRAMELIERQGFLSEPHSQILFGTPQTIWKFNADHYYKVRATVRSFLE